MAAIKEEYIMSSKQREVVGVVIKGSVATEQEQEAVDALPREYKVRLLNGRFVENGSNERINTDHVLNLSGREEIDVWYKDNLLESEVFKEAAKELEAKEAAEMQVILDAKHAEEQKELDAKKEADALAAKKAVEDKAAAEKKAVEDAKKEVAAKKKAASAAKPRTVKK